MQAESCQAYVQEVLKFRKAMNLTSISDAEIFQSRFIKPSLALAQWIPEHGRILDIGSGMGVPGIPLLIAKPSLTGVLVERRKKRAEFLRHVVRKLGLNAEVYDADIQALRPLKVDICVARAVSDERQMLEMCNPHVNPAAVAVFPVPRSHSPVDVAGWVVSGEYAINIDDADGGKQIIRCYQHSL
ncbi:MAG: 16S rRNA (guanine(527)-N(7))-methyltransferase RsmG [Mariprofundus sp.]|nr:16S rRNA (guanine(527)-N(7))-methyltransferase RsmG [Mariprofundus sp.]